MATSTVEDYIKQVFLLQQEYPDQMVPMGRLSVAVGITPGTATTMVKGFAADGLVQYEPRVGVRLTARGLKLAANVLRRHRIAECFLVEVLGMDWSEVHEDAERLEHAISDRVLDRMDALLNRPTRDPHGDPIPAQDGKLRVAALGSLATIEAGASVRVERVLDQTPAFLSTVRTLGLMPGTEAVVVERHAAAGTVTLRLGKGRNLAIALDVAAKLHVAPLTKPIV